MKIRLLRLFLTLWSLTCFPISGWSNTYYPPKSIHPFLNYALLTDPGGISTDLSLWLKGDQGVVLNSGAVSQWTDQSTSSAHAVQSVVADRPTQNTGDRALNFNPSVYFNADHLQVPLDISANTMGEVTLFVVAQGDGSNHTLMGNQSGTGNYFRHMALHRTHKGNDHYYDYPSYSTTSPQITRINYRGVGSSGSATSYVSINHATATSFTESLGAGSLSSFFLGKAGSLNGSYGGHIAEVVVYAKSTSSMENDKIETYLSLKYGIPLGDPQTSDYISSSGAVLWDASTNTGYHYDIMGIGRDDSTELLQKVSRPATSSSINLLVALQNDFTSPNTDPARTVSYPNDQTFLLLGHNNQSLSFTNTQVSSAYISRTSRIWKAATNGAHPEVTLNFEGLPTTLGPIHLLQSPDADFSSGFSDLGPIDLSSKTISSITPTDGSYYTLASVGFDPGLTNFVDQSTIYGDSDTVLPPTSSGSGAWTYASSNLSIAAIHPTTGVITTLQAGQTTITATQAQDGTYAQSSIAKVLTVQPKSLTITADNTTKIYDGLTQQTFTVQYTGFAGGEDANNLSGSLLFTGTATTASDVGTYTSTPQGLTSTNYSITYINGTSSITPLSVTVTPDALTKTYGTADPTLTYSLSATSSTTLTATGTLTRAAGEDVGDYAIGLGTLTNTNYTLTLAPENLSITPLSVTVTPDVLSKTYGNADPTLTYSLSATSSATLTTTGSLTRVSGEDVGDYAIALGTLTNTNYTLSLASENFSITPLAVTVTPDVLTKTYGELDPTLTYSLSATSSATLTTTGNLTRATGEDVGDFAVTLGTLTNTNYTLSLVPENFSITPLAVTVTPDVLTKTYGELDPTLTYSLSATSSATLTATGALTRAAGEDVGDYTINLGTLTNTNYTLTLAPENMSITPLSVTVTPDALTKTYGELDPTLTYSLSATSSATLTTTGSLTRAAGEDVGDYAVTLGTLTNTNYTLSLAPENLSITPLSVTVTPDVLSKTYGELDPVLTYSLSATSSATLTATGTLTRAVGEDVGDYAITLGTLTNTNYTLSLAPENLSITPLSVTVTPDVLSKTYGELDPVLTYSLSATSSATLTATGSLIRVAGEDVGDYAITLGTLTNTNYTLSLASENLSITPLAVTVTPDALTKTYGAADPTLTYSLSATSSATLTATGSLTRAAGEDVGDYAIGLGTLTNTNYTLSLVPENFSITPLAVTVTPDALTKIYGEVDPTLTYSLSATSSATLTATGSLTRAAGEDVGDYAIGLGTLTNTNYILTLAPENLSITPLSVTVTPDALTKIYGEVDPVFTYTLSATSSATLTTTGALDRAMGEDVGTYAIELGTLANANYSLSLAAEDFVVEARTLTVTARDLSKIYDGEVAGGFGVDYTGFAVGEDEADLSGVLSFTGTGMAAVDVGSYTVIPGGWSSNNYHLVFEGGTLTISPLTVAVLPDRLSKWYGAEDPEFTYTLSAENADGLVLEVSGALAREQGESVGVYGLNLGTLAQANYSLSLEPIDFEVLPAELVVTVVDVNRTYDGSSFTDFSVGVTGFVADEGAEVLLGDLVYGGSAVGAIAVGTYEISASGWRADNYQIQYLPGQLTISGAAVTVVPLSGQHKTYGTADPELRYALVPSEIGGVPVLVAGDLARATGELVGTYAVQMGSLTSENAELVLEPADFEIQPRVLDVQVLDDAKLVTTLDEVGYRGVALEGFAPGESAEVVTGNLSIERSNSQVETPGIYPGVLVASGLSAANYQMNYLAGTYTIVPADQLLINCAAASWQYGGDLPIAVEEAKYLSEAQQEVVVLEDPIFDTEMNRFVFDDGAGGKAVFGLTWKDGVASSSGALASGIYQVIPTDVTETSENFSHVITVVGDAQVHPKVIELSVAHPQKVFDGTTDIGPLDLDLIGVRPLDEVSITGIASFEDPHAGTQKNYLISDIGLTGIDSDNYTLPVWGDWTADQGVILPLPVSAVVSGVFSKTYGAPDPEWTWQFTPSSLGGQAWVIEGTPVRASGENAGTYSFGLDALAHPDLALSLEPTKFLIEPAPLEVAVIGGQKRFDGSPFAEIGVEVSGLVQGDEVEDLSGDLVYTGPGVTAVGPGTYAVTAQGWTSPNYAIRFIPGQVRIVRSFIQVYPLEGQTTTYGDPEPKWAYRVDPEFIDGVEVILSGQLGRAPGDLVGKYSFALGSLDYPDYALELSAEQMQILPKPLVVKGIKAMDKVYDGTVDAELDLGDLVWSGLIDEAPGTFSVVGFWLDPHVGTAKSVRLDWALDPWWSARYDVSLPDEVAASITPVPLEVVPVPHQFKVYGSAEPIWEYITRPAAVALTGQLARAEGEDVGLYPFSLGTLAHRNYSLTMGYATGQIVPAPLRVRAIDGFYTYDGQPFTGDFGFEVIGLLGDDPLPEVGISGASQGATGLGRYTLMPKLGTWPNYDVQLIAGTLTIRHDPSRVQVSGVLTPNSGTAEAVWTITNIDQYPNNQVRVYNKNQQLVWSQQGYKNTWRGIDANSYRPLPAAPYYYVVDLKNGKPPIQGWFYLTY